MPEGTTGPDDHSTTLAEVAQAAGVHASTASRALRGESGVGTTTAARVREAADELGYVPNPAAKSLRTGRSRLLGVLVPWLTDVVLATIYEGIEAGAADAGYQAVVANTGDEVETQNSRVETLLGLRVEGLLLGDARNDSPLVKNLARRGIPLVLVSRRLPGAVSFTCDDLLGGRLAGEHLLELGHERVGVVSGRGYASTGIERTRGFLSAYERAGYPVEDDYVVPSAFDVEGGRHGAQRLLSKKPRPTAIFAVNDFAAIGVMGALRDFGATPGRDVAVVGYNDVALSAQLPVALTTIRSPMYEMGRLAATALVSMINGKPGRSRRLTPQLMARASTTGS